jgi:hypothetical protein
MMVPKNVNLARKVKLHLVQPELVKHVNLVHLPIIPILMESTR